MPVWNDGAAVAQAELAQEYDIILENLSEEHDVTASQEQVQHEVAVHNLQTRVSVVRMRHQVRLHYNPHRSLCSSM